MTLFTSAAPAAAPPRLEIVPPPPGEAAVLRALRQACEEQAPERMGVAGPAAAAAAGRLPAGAERLWRLLQEAGFREHGEVKQEIRSLAYAGSPFAVEMCGGGRPGGEPCGICMEADAPLRAVATPPCGHWVCHGCAVRVQQGGGRATAPYKCPFCRQLYPPSEVRCRVFADPGEPGRKPPSPNQPAPPKLARLRERLAGLPAGASALVVVGSRAVASIVANDPVLQSLACAVSACTHSDLSDSRAAVGRPPGLRIVVAAPSLNPSRSPPSGSGSPPPMLSRVSRRRWRHGRWRWPPGPRRRCSHSSTRAPRGKGVPPERPCRPRPSRRRPPTSSET